MATSQVFHYALIHRATSKVFHYVLLRRATSLIFNYALIHKIYRLCCFFTKNQGRLTNSSHSFDLNAPVSQNVRDLKELYFIILKTANILNIAFINQHDIVRFEKKIK